MTIPKMHAGGNRYDTRCQGGGDKLSGLTPMATGFMLSVPFAYGAAVGKAGRATKEIPKNLIFSKTSQIGGIGRFRSATQAPADGVKLPLKTC